MARIQSGQIAGCTRVPESGCLTAAFAQAGIEAMTNSKITTELRRGLHYSPVLAALLLLTLLVMGWWLIKLDLAGPTGQQGPIRTAILVHTVAVSQQADRAIAGDPVAFAELMETAKLLDAIQTADLTEDEKSTLGQVRSAVAELLDGQGDVLALQQAVEMLDEQAPKFGDAINELQNDQSVRAEPALMAQLERFRLLAESLPVFANSLMNGKTDAEQRLVDNEIQLQRVANALQAGDPELGIPPVSGDGKDTAVASLLRRAAQVGDAVQTTVDAAGSARVLQQASKNLADFAAALDASVNKSGGDQALTGAEISAQLWRIYLLLAGGIALAAALLVLWFRSPERAGNASSSSALQVESDQQAILQLLDELGNLADGDLTVQATVNESITGAIADSINYTVEALRELVATINRGALLVDEATKQTQASTRALRNASDAQSRQVKAATEAVQNMAGAIDEISGDAERSSDVARHSVDVAHKGGEAVRRTIEGMNTIRETIQDTSKRIKRLGESSQEIGDIVELINDIADQTNILALNASIQASMAGEAGRGFAVVADEVQRLAERSANATKQIEVLVSTIQSDTNEAVVSMERSTTDVVGGALLAENAGAALGEIEQVSNQIAMLVQNISSSARQQAEAATAVMAIVDRLNKISDETDSSAATTTRFISKLSELAGQLRQSVAGFILPEDRSVAKKEIGSIGQQPDSDAKKVAEDVAGQTPRMYVNQNSA
jgi:twitching motility protein PilJ